MRLGRDYPRRMNPALTSRDKSLSERTTPAREAPRVIAAVCRILPSRCGSEHGSGFGLPSLAGCAILHVTQPRKEGRAMTTFFRHYRQRGPVHALQMRLQG